MYFEHDKLIHFRLLSKNERSLALLALKRRKQQGDLINQAEEHLLQLNGLISNVEMAAVQADVVKAIEAGTEALRKMQEEINLQYVEKLMDKNSDLQNEVRDIQEMLAGSEKEDKDVYDEYQRLEEIVAAEKTQAIPDVPETLKEKPLEVPEVPSIQKPKAPLTQMVRTVPEFEEQ